MRSRASRSDSLHGFKSKRNVNRIHTIWDGQLADIYVLCRYLKSPEALEGGGRSAWACLDFDERMKPTLSLFAGE